ncbi:RNA polymerase III subunit RPC82-domain-containing protein [Dichotomopilus funicola]|uniref:DNA-directed RNA polymerase III subunit RPC3 n=1 Tax=Dichotomopilus funicola TaxID=1934379 RepID=A0AAN6V3D0_9PEZI|nr:RNA polymerase III subunit RPC82-domain-containing protein [Dichotomopilus funicola]
MLVTKPVAELCALLVDELHGELPSRIFAILVSKGRSTVLQLSQYTSMTPRQVRHGLAVLQQHNLLYYHVDPGSELASYEANPENAYNLIRTGKILEMIDTSFGAAAKDVMQNLLLSGQTRILDLVAAYREKIEHAAKTANGAEDDDGIAAETNGINGDSHNTKKGALVIKSTAQLNTVICRLVEAELIDVVHARTFHTSDDILKSVEKEAMAKQTAQGAKGGKGKLELQENIAEGLRKVRAESKSLKRKLEQNGSAAKRRRLFSGLESTNGVHEEETDPILDPRQVIRINYEKCLVDLRNRRLVQYATDMLSETTAYVYGVLLKLLTKDVPRCRADPIMDVGEDQDDDNDKNPGFVTTDQILDNLKTSVDLSLGVGKAEKHQISFSAAEEVQLYPPKKKALIEEVEVVGEASADEEEDSESEGEPDYDSDYKDSAATNGTHDENGINGMNGIKGTNGGTNGTKVTFDESAARKERKMDRPTQLRQHLLILAESTQGFVRHCGRNEWTVDFVPIINSLREVELDSVIERTCGRQGLRLVRILRAKGKLDEKALPNVALMRKPELQQKMLEMQTAGFVAVQEVPRDVKADVKKSFFLWFCDVDRSLSQMLDTSYRTMVHCLQVLEALRHKERDVLETTKRSDVRGREKDTMRKSYYERYSRFLECERKLFAQVMRVDDLVSVLRDF